MYISMQNIFDWAGHNEAQRKFIQGERVFEAGHIIHCGEVEKNINGEVKIFSSYMQTSQIREKPHEIEGKRDLEGVISDFKCSCKAGLSGQCKHIVTTLLHTHALEKFDELSCTDKKCQWKDKQSLLLQKYEPAPVNQHECFFKKRKVDTVELQEGQKKALSDLIINELPYCGLVKHVRGRHSAYQHKETPLSTPEEYAAIKTIFLLQDHQLMEEVKQQKFGPLNSCCEERISRLQGNFVQICESTKAYYDEWMKHRSVRITGSTCYKLYTYIRNNNPDWDKKFNDVFHPENFKSIYTEYGKVTEEKAKKSYVAFTNNKVVCPGLIVSACNPWLAYSPDGIIFENNKPVAVLEIKCPFIGKKSAINETVMSCIGKCLQVTDENIYLKEKHSYYGQVQLGMAVINVKVADFVIYSAADDKVFILQVKRNDIFLKKMLTALKKLYFEKIVHFTCLKNKKPV